MSSTIPNWLREKLTTYKTYNINDLQFHNSLRVSTSTTSSGQTGGSVLFNQPKDIHSFRNVIKNTLLKEFEKDNDTDNYFN